MKSGSRSFARCWRIEGIHREGRKARRDRSGNRIDGQFHSASYIHHQIKDMRLSLIKSTWLDKDRQVQPISIQKHFNKLKSRQDQEDAFGHALAQASVYSSMIEGNHIDLESYLRFSSTGLNTQSKSFREIEDLRAA